MNVRSCAVRGALSLACFVLTATCGALSGVAGAAPERAHAAVRFRPSITVLPPRPVKLRRTPSPASVQNYSVVDRGVPVRGAQSAPDAFNDTGQIVGYVSAAGRTDCYLYDGSAFRSISTLASLTSCQVYGMNDANATTGSVNIVGEVRTLFGGYDGSTDDGKALYVTATPKSALVRTAVFTNDQASLQSVNAGGEALGPGDYYPLGGFATTAPPFVVSSGQGSLRLLQPFCTTVALGCGALLGTLPYSLSYTSGVCGFGGCQIAADGTVLLYDLFSGSLELVAANGSTRDIALDARLDSFPIMNDAKQIVYAAEMVVAGKSVDTTQIYSVATGKVLTVPPLPGVACAQYIPLSMNDAGSVLGYAFCGPPYEEVFFTYDAGNGTQALPAALPGGYYSMNALAINDKDQILVDLEQTSGGPDHWGYLQPLSGAGLRPRATSKAVPSRVEIALGGAPASRARPASPGARAGTYPRARPYAGRAIGSRSATGRVVAALYTVVDDGAPAGSSYTLANPVAFNNTGQIVGAAGDVPYRNNTACLLFDGAAFRNVEAAASIVDCSPLGISDPNPATGSVDVVGSSTSAFDAPDDSKAFVSAYVPRSGVLTTRRFAGNDSSSLVGVNASGAAIGVGAYSPLPGTVLSKLFELAPGGTALAIPAACLTKSGCGSVPTRPCPFGGCDITSNGTLLIANEVLYPNGTIIALKLGDKAYETAINDNGQILYQNGANTEVYSLATKIATLIPHAPGNRCEEYSPLSFNNAGHVLGTMTGCTGSSDSFYVYDPINGTRDLATLLPAGTAMVQPIAINDADRILVELTLPSGLKHWGILVPPQASAARRAFRQAVRVTRDR